MGDVAEPPPVGELEQLARQRLEVVDPSRTLDAVLARLFATDQSEHAVSAFGSSL